MASRLFALLVWAAVAASLAFWGLRWIARPAGVPYNASSVTLDGGAHGDSRRLLTGPATTTPGAPVVDMGAAATLSARLKLLGVIAPRSGTDQGVALLSIDGKPARAVRVGSVIDGEMTLLAINQRGAQIGPGQGPVLVSLDLPPLPPPNMGSLPPPTGVVNGSTPMPLSGGAGGPMAGQTGLAGSQMQAPQSSQMPSRMAPPHEAASGALAAPEGA